MRQMQGQTVNLQAKPSLLGSLLGLAPALGSAVAGPWGAVGGGLLSALGGNSKGLGQAITALPGAIDSGQQQQLGDSQIQPTHMPGDHTGNGDSPEHDQNVLDHQPDYRYGSEVSLPPEDQQLYDDYLAKLQDESPEHADYLRQNPDIFYELLREVRKG